MQENHNSYFVLIRNVVILLAAVGVGAAAGYWGGSGAVSVGIDSVDGGATEVREPMTGAAGGGRRARGERFGVSPVKVVGVDDDGRIITTPVSADDAQRGLCETFYFAGLRKKGKAPLNERYARTRYVESSQVESSQVESSHLGSSHGVRHRNDDESRPIIYPGDVYIDGIPMVNQGKKAYCAAAAAARVLQGYGIEVTMEDMVALVGTDEVGGSDVGAWEKAMRQVAGEHGLRLKTIMELTESSLPFSQLLHNYNNIAEIMHCDQLDVADYMQPGLEDRKAFWEDREYKVQRNVMLADDRKSAAFDENVIGCIEESDPIFWRVTTGDISEQRVDSSENTVRYYERESHMRLIVGYNEARGEVIYSDSWGEGHAHKRMDAQDALSITTGMYYLAE